MEYKDYYQVMGVERTATDEEIKRAYRKLARQYHPDVSKEQDAESRFKAINEAYDVLKDPEKRQAYDQLGHNWKAGQGFNPQDFGGFQPGFGQGGGDFSDFFEQFFGRRHGQHHSSKARAGEDLHTELTVTLEEAYQGASKTLQYEMVDYDAQGYGHKTPKAIKVKVPAGVSDGQQIRLAGQGQAGQAGAKAGDLYIKIRLHSHPLYHVHGHDLHLTVPLAPWEAALGAVIKVPTLGGAVEVKIPVGAKSGAKMRLKGRGLPGKVPGDQYLVLQIQAPAALTPEQQALYEKMAQLFPFDARKALHSSE